MVQFQQLIEDITPIIQPIVEDAGLELVELQYRQESSGWTLRIIMYKKSGVTLDDCTKVSREVSHVLDVEDLIPHKYNLEVSSPGLDRPLKTQRDFERNVGEKVALIVKDADGRHIDVTGIIKDVKNEEISVQTASGQEIFSIENIVKAKLIIEF